MTFRNILAAGVIAATSLVAAPPAVAQDGAPTRVAGTLNDFVWVDVGSGAGPWQVSGTWSAKLNTSSGRGEFVASILGVRSDLWVLQTGTDPSATERAAHTHHVALPDAAVTPIPGGVRLTGTAVITSNGNVAGFTNSPIVVDITGGNAVRFSNMKLTFHGASNEHFGSHAYDGVVTIGR
jgi:hypothetical protein